LTLGRVDEAISAIKEALRLEPGNGQAHQSLGRAYWVGKGDFAAAIPAFRKAIELNPEAGYSYLQLTLLLAWEGLYEEAEAVGRRAVELQDQYISGNAGLQVVGANARLGYVFYLRGRYQEAIREYERGLAFVASSDHALKDRTSIEITMKLGAAYHRWGKPEEAVRFFDRALKAFDQRVAKGADDPYTRYYIACLLALRGEIDRAFDMMQRVHKALPALTAARLRRDPDVDSLRDDPRFNVLLETDGVNT
jgi:tetratricopeptide (TPR) repeat protein